MTNIAVLVDYPDKGLASVGAIVTNVRPSDDEEGRRWPGDACDATGAIEAAQMAPIIL